MIKRLANTVCLLVGVMVLWANVGDARADTTLDRKYALERISFLPSWDNVDNLFRPYVDEAYKEYFSGHSRFVAMDGTKARDILLDTKLDYRTIVEDASVLGSAARAVRAESLIRTRILKEGSKYSVKLDWLHAPRMELIATASIDLSDPEPGRDLSPESLKGELKRGLDALIAKLPFLAHVTGRDLEWVTVNGGRSSGFSKGDRLIVATLDEVKVHPILKSVADWRMERVGILEVDSVDGGLAFCRVIEEEEGRQIARYQKIIQISRAPLGGHTEVAEAGHDEEPLGPPKVGWIEAGPTVGSAVRQLSTDARAVEGSGLLFGGHMDSQVWLNRTFFGELAISYGGFSNGQEDLSPTAGANATSSSATALSWKIGAGYTYLLSDDFYGPKGWAKIGFRSTSYSLPSSTTDLTGDASFAGLYFGIGGDLPIRSGWGAIVNFEIGLFNAATLSGFTALPGEAATAVRFSLGAYYLIGPRMGLRGTIQVLSHGADFGTDGSISHKVISFTPALVYFF